MKGIILAGGSGTRLHPLTLSVSKQLLPVYDKPMIYYPLSTLMLAGIKDILIISTPYDLPNYKKLLGTGKSLGINLSYIVQKKPEGLAQAFILGEKFIGDDSVCLVLGDNIFYGKGFSGMLNSAIHTVNKKNKATIFSYYVDDPERYGVAEFDKIGNVLSIEEKPAVPKSNYAVVGLYFYPHDVVQISKSVKPSARGELEITSVNNEYLNKNRLKNQTFTRGDIWLDTGTHDSLADAGEFIRVLEKNQGFKVACIEEIAMIKGFISKKQAYVLGKKLGKTQYGKYIINKSNQWK